MRRSVEATRPGTTARTRTLRGDLRRRLLVNAVVDPDEAASRLPPGVWPHVTGLGTVVGCCLLEIDRLRPERLPEVAGIGLRAAAHRISVEWDDGTDEPAMGVYVPARSTDSRLAVVLGGRLFPGVHRRTRVDIGVAPGGLSWSVGDERRPDEFAIRVAVSLPRNGCDRSPIEACDPIAGACLGATIGLSPDHAGALEAARMEPDHRRARAVVVEDLDSAFISSFATAAPAPAYLMEDVGVTWSRAAAPRGTALALPGCASVARA